MLHPRKHPEADSLHCERLRFQARMFGPCGIILSSDNPPVRTLKMKNGQEKKNTQRGLNLYTRNNRQLELITFRLSCFLQDIAAACSCRVS